MKYRVTLTHGDIYSLGKPYTEFRYNEPKIVDKEVVDAIVADDAGVHYNIKTIIGNQITTKRQFMFDVQEWSVKEDPKTEAKKEETDEGEEKPKKKGGRPKKEGTEVKGVDLEMLDLEAE